MTTSSEPERTNLTRRNAIKLAGSAVAGLAVGGAMLAASTSAVESADECVPCEPTCPAEAPTCKWDHPVKSEKYTYFDQLPPYYPFSAETPTTIPKLGEDEMRITFMGSSIPPNIRRKQAMMSIFVEVGWKDGKPLDNFVFDCGSGVVTNYQAMNVGFGRMDKVFINHLHGDHMSDITHIYCFGPSQDRLTPLYVFGPGKSNVPDPRFGGKIHEDGTKAFCEHLRAAWRWHSESFSFQPTSYSPPPLTGAALQEAWGLPCLPEPVGDPGAPDDPWDGYALVPIELDWENGGVAYDNKSTGVKISYFKVIHARKGSLGYKVEWTPPGIPGAKTLSMIYTSDTKPETLCVENARNGGKGVDVFIHEMVVPADVWAMKVKHLTTPPPDNNPMVQQLKMVQNSSHTPQGAFGYLVSQLNPRPRLTVATHFPVADDTVECAMKSVLEHVNVVQGRDPKPKEDAARITWSFDCMVISVSKDKILEQRGVISDFNTCATVQVPAQKMNLPKYNKNGAGDPYAQIDESTAIQPCDCETGECHYRADGY